MKGFSHTGHNVDTSKRHGAERTGPDAEGVCSAIPLHEPPGQEEPPRPSRRREGETNHLMGTGPPSRGGERPGTREGWCLHGAVTVRNATELFACKELILCCVHFTPIKKQQKKISELRVQPQPLSPLTPTAWTQDHPDPGTAPGL